MIRARSGPFVEQPYYAADDFDSMAIAELGRVDLLPAEPGPTRVDRFIEKRFGIIPEYDDLPAGVLGFTAFGLEGPEAVIISRTLSEEGSRPAERLINSTLAHESGHMIMHRDLFALQRRQEVNPLFVDFDMQTILCRRDIVEVLADTSNTPRYNGEWWEYQANQMIGALLLPRSLVYETLDPLLSAQGQLGVKVLERKRREEATQRLAEVFDVNPAAARIRVERLFHEIPEGQLTL